MRTTLAAPETDAWILARRPERNPVDPWKPHLFFLEQERAASGSIVPVAAVFLTNRECPWRCLMCDLWKNTLETPTLPGAIPAQIDYALSRLNGPARQIKLYNSGSFFDSGAIPVSDYPAIASRLIPFERVIAECHPALVGDRAAGFRRLLPGELEVAMGLETVHPEILKRLNKRMTLDQFAKAAAFLQEHDIHLRAFVLVKPPFMEDAEVSDWTRRSIEFAFDSGATAVSCIPVRAGNGALDLLAQRGEFSPPRLSMLESALEQGIQLRRGRVFADLWDLERFSDCPACFPARRERLQQMNLRQELLSPVSCAACGGGNA